MTHLLIILGCALYYAVTAPIMVLDANAIPFVVVTAAVHIVLFFDLLAIAFTDPGIIPKVLIQY